MRRHLVIMARAPMIGRVKTRLAADIGHVAATAFYRRSLARLARKLGNDPRWQTHFAVTPDTSLGDSVWPLALAGQAQGPGNLGQRMGRIMQVMPPGPVIIVGTDIPGLGPDQVARAFAMLGHADAVFGPSPDGGYYLVGLKRVPRVPDAFANVRWSSRHALDDTLSNLKGFGVAYLELLADIDTGNDWRRWRAGNKAGPR